MQRDTLPAAPGSLQLPSHNRSCLAVSGQAGAAGEGYLGPLVFSSPEPTQEPPSNGSSPGRYISPPHAPHMSFTFEAPGSDSGKHPPLSPTPSSTNSVNGVQIGRDPSWLSVGAMGLGSVESGSPDDERMVEWMRVSHS